MTKLEHITSIIRDGIADDLASDTIARAVIEALREPPDHIDRLRGVIAIVSATCGLGHCNCVGAMKVKEALAAAALP